MGLVYYEGQFYQLIIEHYCHKSEQQNKFPFNFRKKKNGEKTNFCATSPIVLIKVVIMSMLCMISLEIGQFDQIFLHI